VPPPQRTSSADRYRRERAPCSGEFAKALSDVAGGIGDPAAKLRYLRAALEGDDVRLIARLPLAPVRRALYRLRGVRALEALGPATGQPIAIATDLAAARRRAQRAGAATLAAPMALVAALLAGLAVRPDAERSPAFLPQPTLPIPGEQSAEASTTGPEAHTPAKLEPVAEDLPVDTLGVAPTTIWLADRGPDWELYSNGLRIETAYVVRGAPRRYVVHDRTSGAGREIHTKPVGILYHTSESDLWPLEEAYRLELRRSSAGLVKYVRKMQAYNYLIDRFGRVYRVVDDETRANHAGRGVWARDDEVYLDLNNAFLGVSFESRWDGGRTLPITRAQLIAGRNLTNYLRQRFAIPPEMCVTHGLTSVNPARGLIAYHRDWARGFPFEAFGLPDLYAVPTPSVALFGFAYDDDLLRAVGERWPGLIAAEQRLLDEAGARSMSVDAFRRERQHLYFQWSREAPGGDSAMDHATQTRG
jgi:hypothetical protein